MVNKQNLLRWVLAALVVILLGYHVVGRWTNTLETASDSPDTAAIIVADRYIPAFSAVNPRLVGVKDYPRGLVPPGALFAAKELLDAKGQPLFLSAVTIPEGQPVTRTLLMEFGKSNGLAPLLTPGKVAISFAVDKERGVGNWIEPGDTIAIYQTQPRTHILFPSVTVLAVDKTKLGHPDPPDQNKESSVIPFEAGSDENASILTVLLNVAQASLFIEAKEQGRLTVALRASGDSALENIHD